MKYKSKIIILFLYLVCCILLIDKVSFAYSLKVKVLNLNIDNKFIVLDIGKDDGVFKGRKFNVFKNNKFMGTIKVLKVKKDVAAFDTTLLKNDIPIAPKDVLLLEDENQTSQPTKLPGITVKRRVNEKYSDEDLSISGGSSSSGITDKRKTPLLIKPFKAAKDFTVSVGRGIKNWFKQEEEEMFQPQDETKYDGIESRQVSSVSKTTAVKVKTNIAGSRRKVLFMINEELKNRGFIVTNYSIIEGTIHAQKPLPLSTYSEIFANMKSAIDYKILYVVDVEKLDKDNSQIIIDVSASYKKSGKYNQMKVGRGDEMVQEAKEILFEVKNKI